MNKYNVRCSIEEKKGFPFDEFPISQKESTSNFIIVKSNKLKLLL